MKALSLTQPWAQLVASGTKRFETRSWPTNYRGPLAIHAAKGMPDWATTFLSDVIKAGLLPPGEPLPVGAVVAIAELTACWHSELACHGADVTPREMSLGDWTPGRYVFRLERVRCLAEPIPAKGALGLWNWQPPAGVA